MFLSAQLVFEGSTEGLKACSIKKKLLITAMENKSVKKDVNKKKVIEKYYKYPLEKTHSKI